MPWLLLASLLGAAAEPARPAGAGLYAVWASAQQLAKIDALLPYLKGGQAFTEWHKLETREGVYDFTALDAALERLAGQGRLATVQVNANDHPDYLYDRVAVLGKFDAGPRNSNPRGHLQYWHPDYLASFQRLLRALGAHCQASPHRDSILGVRLNWNALSTEHSLVPRAFQQPESWTPAPHGRPYPVPYSREVQGAYQKAVLETYLEAFAPEIRIFLRNNVLNLPAAGEMIPPLLRDGRLALFHTSTEFQPRSQGVEQQYRTFIEYCRSGVTLAYAEPWASSEGNHGAGMVDPRPVAPCQWNYWMCLANLHCGVSFIAVYGVDLARADNPEYKAAFDRVERYAGYHASPTTSPGAWVALREGEWLKGDYTFLMERLEGGEPLTGVGPMDQRLGAWARRLGPGEPMTFRLDPRFAASLQDRRCRVEVTLLDDAVGPLDVALPGVQKRLERTGSGRWVTAAIVVPAADFGGDQPDVAIAAPTGAVLHMVEVLRG